MSDIRNQHGAPSWGELITPDPEAAASFYEKVLGWKSESMPMPDGGAYTVFTTGEGAKVAGAMAPTPDIPEGVPPHWGIYVTVKDVDAAVAAAEANGGTVVMPAMDMPEVGRMAHIRDPQGAHIALITYVTPFE